MEKLPQQNQKEEININEKIAKYKDYINSLREKYVHLLDYQFETYSGSITGSPGKETFFFQPKSLGDYKDSFDKSQRITEQDEFQLNQIRRFINDNTKDASKYILPGFNQDERNMWTLKEWLDKFDQGLELAL